LGDLGIEFAPPPKIEPVSFRDVGRRPASPSRGEQGAQKKQPARNASHSDAVGNQQDKPKRKEINLSELRKALEESLDKKSPEKKEEPEEKSKPARNASNSDAGGNNNKKVIKPGETVKF